MTGAAPRVVPLADLLGVLPERELREIGRAHV